MTRAKDDRSRRQVEFPRNKPPAVPMGRTSSSGAAQGTDATTEAFPRECLCRQFIPGDGNPTTREGSPGKVL